VTDCFCCQHWCPHKVGVCPIAIDVPVSPNPKRSLCAIASLISASPAFCLPGYRILTLFTDHCCRRYLPVYCLLFLPRTSYVHLSFPFLPILLTRGSTGEVYTNCLLANLNARKKIRDAGDNIYTTSDNFSLSLTGLSTSGAMAWTVNFRVICIL
jgi:hypothetical protein